MREYLVAVSALLRHAGTTKLVAFREPFDPDGVLRAPSPGAAEVPEGADVDVRLTLTSYLGGITARGEVTAPWRAACRRCAQEATGELTAHVDERFRPGATAEDEDAYPLDDEVVDLAPLVRDAVLLELPLAPLCRPDCAGLCPSCGEDRNVTDCGCRPERDARWATLDALRTRDRA